MILAIEPKITIPERNLSGDADKEGQATATGGLSAARFG